MRLLKPIFALLFAANLCLLAGCNNAPNDPRQHRITISTDPSLAPPWQQQLGDSAQRLTPNEQQLLANYIERMQYRLAHTATPTDVFKPTKTNPAIDPSNPNTNTNTNTNINTQSDPSVSNPVRYPISILVATALVEQRLYEREHPFNPTGKPLTLQEQYPLQVIATPTSRNEDLATTNLPQRWQVAISNLGKQPLVTFIGALALQPSVSVAPENGKLPTIAVNKTQFVPAIAVGKIGRFIVEVPPAMVANFTPTQLAEPQSIGLVVHSGVFAFENGDSLTIAAVKTTSAK